MLVIKNSSVCREFRSILIDLIDLLQTSLNYTKDYLQEKLEYLEPEKLYTQEINQNPSFNLEVRK